MKLIGRKLVTDFMQKYADARDPLAAWVAEVADAHWKGPADIKARYASASFLANNGVIFNIKGNKYRLKVHVTYEAELVNVKNIGTHAEYDRW